MTMTITLLPNTTHAMPLPHNTKAITFIVGALMEHIRAECIFTRTEEIGFRVSVSEELIKLVEDGLAWRDLPEEVKLPPYDPAEDPTYLD